MTAAFYGAVIPNSKKPIKLTDLLIPPTKTKPKRRQTVAEQVAIAKAWTAATAPKPKRRLR